MTLDFKSGWTVDTFKFWDHLNFNAELIFYFIKELFKTNIFLNFFYETDDKIYLKAMS